MTDMRHPETRAGMPSCIQLWDSGSRAAAAEIAVAQWGPDGTKTPFVSAMPRADLDAIAESMVDTAAVERGRAAKFANGVMGYVDDRLADGPGWDSFDPKRVSCPVVLVHGESDTVVPVSAAHYTASLISHAELRLYPTLGHMSITEPTLYALAELARGFV